MRFENKWQNCLERLQLFKFMKEASKISFLKYIGDFQNQLEYTQLDYKKYLLLFFYNGLSIMTKKKYWKRKIIPINLNDAFALASQVEIEE